MSGTRTFLPILLLLVQLALCQQETQQQPEPQQQLQQPESQQQQQQQQPPPEEKQGPPPIVLSKCCSDGEVFDVGSLRCVPAPPPHFYSFQQNLEPPFISKRFAQTEDEFDIPFETNITGLPVCDEDVEELSYLTNPSSWLTVTVQTKACL